jgi:hypothetical protein
VASGVFVRSTWYPTIPEEDWPALAVSSPASQVKVGVGALAQVAVARSALPVAMEENPRAVAVGLVGAVVSWTKWKVAAVRLGD